VVVDEVMAAVVEMTVVGVIAEAGDLSTHTTIQTLAARMEDEVEVEAVAVEAEAVVVATITGTVTIVGLTEAVEDEVQEVLRHTTVTVGG
jgi:hypothetical protein